MNQLLGVVKEPGLLDTGSTTSSSLRAASAGSISTALVELVEPRVTLASADFPAPSTSP